MKRHLPVITATISLIALGLWLFPNSNNLFQFDWSAIARGELWRGITCHLTHWSAGHLLWDLAAFMVLAMMVEHRSRRLLLGTLGASAIGISGVVWLLETELTTYRGLSGIDSALFATLMVLAIRDSVNERNWRASILPLGGSVLFLLKLYMETRNGSAVFVDTAGEFIPVPLAHGIGAAVGAVSAMIASSRARRPRRGTPASIHLPEARDGSAGSVHSSSANAAHVVAAWP